MKSLAVIAALLTLGGCSKNIQTKEAVHSAIMEYLTARQDKTGINMSAMNVEVVTMNFEADKARVTVAFNLKTGETGMQMPYELAREGNKWVVKGMLTTGKELPTELPPALPPDHPSIQSGQLPAGHPAVGAKQ